MQRIMWESGTGGSSKQPNGSTGTRRRQRRERDVTHPPWKAFKGNGTGGGGQQQGIRGVRNKEGGGRQCSTVPGRLLIVKCYLQTAATASSFNSAFVAVAGLLVEVFFFCFCWFCAACLTPLGRARQEHYHRCGRSVKEAGFPFLFFCWASLATFGTFIALQLLHFVCSLFVLFSFF